MYLQNKYTKWYNSIILRSQNRSIPATYTEKHHIIPRSLKGDNTNANIAILTTKEHFLCHLLLVKMTNGNAQFKMIKALTMIMGVKNIGEGRYIANSRWYAYARERNIQNINAYWSPEKRLQHSDALKKYNRTVDKTSEEYISRIEKIRVYQKKKVWTDNAIANRITMVIRSANNRRGKKNPLHAAKMQGRTQSLESNRLRSIALKGRKTSVGNCRGVWFKSPDNIEILFYPFKITANRLAMSTFRLKKLITDNTYEYNGWKYMRLASNDDIDKLIP